jgi:hypothetical protein
MYWFRSFFVVGAWKPERVQQVHELIAPADRLSLARPFAVVGQTGSFVYGTDRPCPVCLRYGQTVSEQQQQNSKERDPLEQELGAMSDVTIVASIVA